jgi:hypothetical protein
VDTSKVQKVTKTTATIDVDVDDAAVDVVATDRVNVAAAVAVAGVTVAAVAVAVTASSNAQARVASINKINVVEIVVRKTIDAHSSMVLVTDGNTLNHARLPVRKV